VITLLNRNKIENEHMNKYYKGKIQGQKHCL